LSDQNYSFVVRVWLESSDRADRKRSVWRGSVEQIGNNQRVYFSEFNEISRFIEEQIKFQATAPSSNLRRLLEKIKSVLKEYSKK
jgi:hypothetical protein